jgi:hypothetical protein
VTDSVKNRRLLYFFQPKTPILLCMQAAKDGYTNVAVFGFAGGHMQPGQPELLSSELFEKMVTEAHRIITETWALDLNVVRLVSGCSIGTTPAAKSNWHC